MTRDERQSLSEDIWEQKGHKGTVEAVTGFGKTKIAIKAIYRLRRNDSTRKVVVVVPTIQLRQQWQEVLTEYGQHENSEVYVINTIIQRQLISCSLLILDEIHRYAAHTFSAVFKKVQYHYILGLTATMQRLDQKHVLLQKYAPIIDRITMIECRRNRWIAPLTEYNWGISLTEDDKALYVSLKEKFQKVFDKFANDFNLMKDCSMALNPRKLYSEKHLAWVYVEPAAVTRARSLGWTGNSAKIAYHIMMENKTRPKHEQRSVWGGNNAHPFAPEWLRIHAINGMKLTREMKDIVHRMESKVHAAAEIILALKMKTITFAEYTQTADRLAHLLGNDAVVYHSDVKADIVDGKKVSGAQRRRDAIETIKNGTKRYLCTAKALDQGADFPDLELGVILSRTSSPTQYTQRRGRVGRKYVYENGVEKEAIIINIYVKETKDYNWLVKSQKDGAGVIWVDSIEEILINEGLLPSEL